MTLVAGDKIGKLKTTTRKVENASPEYVKDLVEPPVVVEGEGSIIYEVVSSVFSYETQTCIILAKQVR